MTTLRLSRQLAGEQPELTLGPLVLYADDVWSYMRRMTQPQFSRAQLSSIARVPEGALTFWLRRALIRPSNDVSGRGNHRRFSLTELKLAAFLREAHRAGMNIAAMEAIVEAFRAADALLSKFPTEMKYFTDVLSHNDEDDGVNRYISFLIDGGRIDGDMAAELRRAQSAYPMDRIDDLWVWINFKEAGGLWVATLNGEDRWTLNYRTGYDTLETAFAIVFDCARIFGPIHAAVQALEGSASASELDRG